MSYVNRRAERRNAAERDPLQRPDSLRSRDGQAIPVWDSAAADPIDYLASVIDVLPGSRSTPVEANR
jgi:hypothetical protein